MLFWLCDVLNKISWDPDVDPALREVCGRLATDVDLSFLNRDECALWRAVERLKEAAAEAHRASVAQYSLKEDGRLHEVVCPPSACADLAVPGSGTCNLVRVGRTAGGLPRCAFGAITVPSVRRPPLDTTDTTTS